MTATTPALQATLLVIIGVCGVGKLCVDTMDFSEEVFPRAGALDRVFDCET